MFRASISSIVSTSTFSSTQSHKLASTSLVNPSIMTRNNIPRDYKGIIRKPHGEL